MSDERYAHTSLFLLSHEDCNDLDVVITFALGSMDMFGMTRGVKDYTERLEALQRRFKERRPQVMEATD